MVVVDTNIIVPLFLQSAESARAKALHSKDQLWQTEPLALIELSNVFATYYRAKFLSPGDATDLLRRAEEFLGPNLFSVSNQEALELTFRYGVTAYDARFLAVAKKLDAKLVTEDSQLRAAAPEITQSLTEALQDQAK